MISLRNAKTGDEQALMVLHEECLPVRYSQGFMQRACLGQSTKRGRVAIVAEVDEVDLVGFLIAEREALWTVEQDLVALQWPFRQKGTVVYVQTLGVTTRMRRSGIATQLLKRLAQVSAAAQDVDAEYLHALASNTPAIRLYERAGYVQASLLPKFYSFHNQNHDAVLLVRRIHADPPPPSSWLSLPSILHVSVRSLYAAWASLAALTSKDPDDDFADSQP